MPPSPVGRVTVQAGGHVALMRFTTLCAPPRAQMRARGRAGVSDQVCKQHGNISQACRDETEHTLGGDHAIGI